MEKQFAQIRSITKFLSPDLFKGLQDKSTTAGITLQASGDQTPMDEDDDVIFMNHIRRRETKFVLTRH